MGAGGAPSATVGLFGSSPVGTTVRWIGTDVNVRVFYPAIVAVQSEGDSAQRARWIPDPQSVYLRGYARFLGLDVRPARWLFGLLFGSLRMEAVENLNPDVSRRLPVVIFSHGLGGTATAYAKLCCSLASHGCLVLALEHQDGSASATLTVSGTPLYYQAPTPDDSESKRRHIRQEQLDQRCREIQRVIEWLNGVTSDSAEDALLESLLQAVDPQQVTLCGHSFGGATVVRWCLSSQAVGVPLKHCILLDPWLWPLLQADGRVPAPAAEPASTLMIINGLFLKRLTPVERRALQTWPAVHRLVLLGAAHQVQSDFEHRLPRVFVRLVRLASRNDPDRLFDVQTELIQAFLGDDQEHFNRLLARHRDLVNRFK
ncbi:Platelet-activating factor acetylhydrolase [Cyanidiococcus yangmingshanensis]|uniref:1-alkyl-2-acetylglycerophosphocholine esterase n=1 Tax=Cyanidiococcus yangmingshanensis TaxID=2690220 RepID=A0A7J7IN03_9RHOD|nr:Platelet-activating factor acetylhydrolase [Cyanidiococcus yangmingshanensis]